MSANIEFSSYFIHSVLHRWCFNSSDIIKIEAAWLVVVIIASATLQKFDVDYTLLQRRLLPHFHHVYTFFQRNIPENMYKTSDFSLNNACHSLAILDLCQGIVLEVEAMSLWKLARYERHWD